MTHSSKVDVYIVFAIALAIVVFMMGDYWIAGPVLLVLFLSAYPQSYETAAQALVIHTALGKQVIPYRVISFIGPVSEGGVIRIRFGLASELRISPADPDLFFADMATHTPHLVKRGQRLVGAYA
jgi:hypothetical protein